MLQVQELAKAAARDRELGAYGATRAADMEAADKRIENAAWLRKEHMGHYLFNPFLNFPFRTLSWQPLQELGARISRRADTIAGSLMDPNRPGWMRALVGSRSARQRLREGREDLEQAESGSTPSDVKALEKYEDKYGTPGISGAPGAPKVGMAKRADEEDEKLGPFGATQAAKMQNLDRLIALAKYNRENNPGNYWLNPFVGGPISEATDRLNRAGRSMVGNVVNPKGESGTLANVLTGGLLGAAGGGLGGGALGAALTPHALQTAFSGGLPEGVDKGQLMASLGGHAGWGSALGALAGGGLGAGLGYMYGGGPRARHKLRDEYGKLNMSPYGDETFDANAMKMKQLGALTAQHRDIPLDPHSALTAYAG